MTMHDVSRYYYAMKTVNSIVERRNFSSTFEDKSASLAYSDFGTTRLDHFYNILLISEFPKPCKTAIDLSRVFEHLPRLSQFEDELLIPPYTLYTVVKSSGSNCNRSFFDLPTECVCTWPIFDQLFDREANIYAA